MSKYIRLFPILLIVIIAVIVIVGCDNSSVDPDDETMEAAGQLRLVPLSNNSLSKVITDENGQQWLPKSEMPMVLAKTAAVDIYYGELKATRTLQYVLMNVGNLDVFDIYFNAQDLYIYPETFGLIPASTQGDELSALPIVNIIKEHVIPIEGVGALLEMNVGTFIDILNITYHYKTSGDTIEVVDDYDVSGTKMGVIIKPTIADTSLLESHFLSEVNFNDTEHFVSYNVWNPNTLESLHLNNVGNGPIEYQLEVWIREAYLDSMVYSLNDSILPDSYIDLDFANDYYPPYPSEGGFFIRVDFGPTPYIIGFEDHISVDGSFHFFLDFYFQVSTN